MTLYIDLHAIIVLPFHLCLGYEMVTIIYINFQYEFLLIALLQKREVNYRQFYFIIDIEFWSWFYCMLYNIVL